MASFKRLVRFAQGAQVYYGDLIESVDSQYTVKILLGSPFEVLKPTDEIVKTDKVRCGFPLWF